MKGFIRFIVGLVIVLVAIILIAVGFLKLYFTEDKIISLVKPRIEELTKRKIDIGGAEFSALKGFVLKDIAIKEADGREDFVTLKEFSINYDLWPLLEKKVQVSSISLVEPTVRIVRLKDGSFNYESLIPKGESQKNEKKPPTTGTKTAVPVAVTLDRIAVSKARISFRDELDEIPDSDALLDLNMKLKITPDGNFLFSGDLGIEAKAKRNGAEAKIAGKADFDPNKIAFNANLGMETWKVFIKGNVRNYMAVPKIELDASSDVLNIDEIQKRIALLTSTQSKAKKGKENATAVSEATPNSIIVPPIVDKMEAKGKVTIGVLVYQNVPLKDISLKYALKNGIFTLDKKVGQFSGGQMSSHIVAVLKDKALPFDGTLDIKDVNIEGILEMLSPKMHGLISGALNTDLKFSGKAQPQELIKKTLVVEGTYGLKDGVIRKNPVTIALSRLLKLKALEEPKFSEAKGNLRLEKGWVIFKSLYSSKDIGVNIEKGRVSLDGSLDIPMVLRLSKALSQDLVKKQKALSVLLDETGTAVLPITIKGNYDRPIPTLNMKKAKDQLIKGVIKGFFGN